MGPLSAGTSWRGTGAGGRGGSLASGERGGSLASGERGGSLAWLILGGISFEVVGWPYLLGVHIAIQCGRGSVHQPLRGDLLILQVVYIAALLAWFLNSLAQLAAL